MKQLLELYSSLPQIKKILLNGNGTVAVKGLFGSAPSIVVGTVASQQKGVHIVVCDTKDEAGYFYNDLVNFWSVDNIFFFPSAYKRSISYGELKAGGQVQRSALLTALKGLKRDEFTVVCTYPEAISEKTPSQKELNNKSATIRRGDKVSMNFIVELLVDLGFSRSEFVCEPGQFAVRGGIIDLFSFADNKPYRLDFFGDEIDSIRIFDLNTQLSTDKCDQIEVVAAISNREKGGVEYVWIADFLEQCKIDNYTFWINDGELLLSKTKELREKLIKDSSDLSHLITDYKTIERSLNSKKTILFREGFAGCKSDCEVQFSTAPQPSFNKNFELLSSFFVDNIGRGFSNYLLTHNTPQVERLTNIFSSIGQKKELFQNIPATIHEGFTDNDLKISLFTDHQIFERHHRYKVDSELPKAQNMSAAELSALTIGDYVVHIDHGVGKFGGLIRTNDGGKINEAVKLVYRDGDTLLVNVHSLHKISKYRDKESLVQPKIDKLGHGAWTKLKNVTKGKLKDIARDLISLYAKRKDAKGYAFSGDGYMQNELEASFMYEDTPDQQKATAAFKKDMESQIPMDRLVCGDVGFGKTEIAIRAAFKAACDGKQVAVLVPTTILALQHFRSFSRRLKDFPVRVELLSRVKSAKEVSKILEDVEKGKVDILIGTHKILSKKIAFKDLGLLVIDEEQKFGVSSKEKLRQYRENIDTLTLTATPIPRTLQFSLMGARDLSIINTPPPNRQPVTTEVHNFNDELIKEAVEYELGRGGQLFFVHNRVDNIEHIASVITSLVPHARVVVGHGQMKPAELEKKVTDFIYGEYDVLVATTIIESGIDISNANTIIINNAQNFGLSDLHQLRGRVGRTNRKAYCYLLVNSAESLSERARRRLYAIEDFSDLGSGFNIAMQDLDIRGAGNLLGAEQSGFIADVGFETYQKILNEAIAELREEDGTLIEETQEIGKSENNRNYITDCQIDVGFEAFIPGSYVSSQNEKIELYRRIDNLESDSEQQELVASLADRFGRMPLEVERLLSVVAIRRKALYLGFEKVIVKNGFLIMHFIYNSSSAYYDTERFRAVTSYIAKKGEKQGFKLKDKGTMLLLSISGVETVEKAEKIVTNMYDSVCEEPDGATKE